MCSKRHQKFWSRNVEEEWKKWLREDFKQSLAIIKENIDKPWDWSEISRNPTMEMGFLGEHPNSTMVTIKENPDKPWNWNYVCRNPKDDFIERKCREYMAVYKIKEAWKKCYYSPCTRIGKRRLRRSYDMLFC